MSQTYVYEYSRSSKREKEFIERARKSSEARVKQK
jgi:hypothetical protein